MSQVTRLPSGVIVASIENYSPVSRIAIVANAGSRFEDGDNLGVTHCLRVASGLVSSFVLCGGGGGGGIELLGI